MNKFILGALLFFISLISYGQELNCEVIVNAEQTGNSNVSVFNTLENALTEFVNQTNWTDKNFEIHERINCSMFINITEFDGSSFSGSIQVQSSRPVYGSTMVSPIFNYKDNNFSFSYTEYEPLEFNINEYSSNLVSVVSFYVYTILGLDADTFSENGGTGYYETAKQIVSTAQQSNKKGWQVSGGSGSRFNLNNDLLSNAYNGYRNALYTYHRMGLDLMHNSVEEGKKRVSSAILELGNMNDQRPNSLLVRTFFDAKANEIEQIFSGGPSISIKEVINALNDMAPTYTKNWSNIRY
ncbi:MAG TPA: DUF4835 family protein [Salinimicrobium sp.]|nr:DUF4835 family protein [Salinimicrobium sp.]